MVPKQIGRFEIIKELGRGGMATVFLARDPRFERDVAIKVLPAQFTHDPQFTARFEREAKTIASLAHEAIATVFDYGEFESQPYLVMQYMEGGSLAERIPKGGMPLEEILPIIQRIAPALDKAHKKGIIHRDLKPANILFDGDDKAHIGDFGVVKVEEATASLTIGVIGTPEYISPEQGEGDKKLDGRSDIYALGVVVFHLLTGRLPYQADTPMSVIYAHINKPLPDIQSINPDVPGAVKAALEKALAKDRESRYASAGAFAEALAQAAGAVEKKAAAPKTEIIEEPQAESKRKPAPGKRKRRIPVWGWLAGGALLFGCAAILGLGMLAQGGLIANLIGTETPQLEITPFTPTAELAAFEITQTADAVSTKAAATVDAQVAGVSPTDPCLSAESGVLFADNFSTEECGWPVFSNAESAGDYFAGAYSLIVTAPVTQAVSPGLNLGGVSVRVDATLVDGFIDSFYGLMCRQVDDDNHYAAIVTSNGFYGILKLANNEYDILGAGDFQPLEADVFTPGVGATNELTLVCLEDTITLFVNSAFIKQVRDSEYERGDVGFVAGELEEGSTEVQFDNFLALEP